MGFTLPTSSCIRKYVKYLGRILDLLVKDKAPIKEIFRIQRNLNYDAEVAPFGRPYLAPLSNLTVDKELKDIVNICQLSKIGLRV